MPVPERRTCGANRAGRGFVPVLILVLVLLLLALNAPAQLLQQFEKTVTEFTLDNGMKFIVVERHEVPIVSFHLYVDVGGVDEPTGETGVAHMFEHMAFKGTDVVGTRDFRREKAAIAAVDKAYAALAAERRKGDRADKQHLKELEEAFKKAQEEADQWVETDAYSMIIESAGGVGLNASTSKDATRYYFALPSNKLNLWFLMQSEAFASLVLREFYKERDVVIEERRMRTDSHPIGKLVEEFMSVAYKAHPYGQPIIGHRSDLDSLTREEAAEFFRTHYVPAAMTAVIVGDVNPKEARRLAETYWGRLPKRPRPEPVRTVEPSQQGERRVMVEAAAQPYLLMGYHRPGVTHPDRVVLDVISEVLGRGRTSWLYTSLVKEKRIAVAAEAFSGFPGDKYPQLFAFFGVPSAGHTAEEVEKGMEEQIDRLKKDQVPADTLEKVKRRMRADLVRGLRSNDGLAEALALNQALLGDWRFLFRDLEKIEKVTAADVQRVANEYFHKRNRTVATIVPLQASAKAAGGGE